MILVSVKGMELLCHKNVGCQNRSLRRILRSFAPETMGLKSESRFPR